MISRTTIYSLLLGLILALALFMRITRERDRCNTYPAGGIPPRTEYVVSGTRQFEISCSDWWMRRPQSTQILLIVDIGLGMIFVLFAAGDLRSWVQRAKARKIPNNE